MLPKGFHFFERGWLSSNSLLIQDFEQSVLFDSGYVSHSDQLLNLLDETLLPATLGAVVNTHLHSDHCGGNHALQRHFPDIDVYVAESQFIDVLEWTTSSLTYVQTGQSCPRFTPTHTFTTNSVLRFCNTEWHAFSSPGHDNDSFVFFEPNLRILISADALWGEGLGVIFPEFLGGVGFDCVAQTFDLIESLQPTLVIPGHGPIFTDVENALFKGRQKLAGFQKSPAKHAIYAAKVLIKFKLMELHHVDPNEFTSWCLNSPLIRLIHERFFAGIDINHWLEDLFLELETRQALRISDGRLINK